MAKQSGLHQIKGKIGEYSYYRQTGVNTGLIRQINQGMSERVKTSPEYENTRLNNAEFKLATQAAGSLFSGVQPILRPTKTLFRTSRLAADLYKILLYNNGAWGKRILSHSNRDAICNFMHKFAKRKMSDYADIVLGTFDDVNERLSVNITPQTDVLAYMNAMGATHIQFKVYQMQFYEDTTIVTPELLAENIVVLQSVETETWDPELSDPGTTLVSQIDCKGVDLMILTGHIMLSFIVVVALPIRRTEYGEQVLQNNCTFAILTDPNHGA